MQHADPGNNEPHAETVALYDARVRPIPFLDTVESGRRLHKVFEEHRVTVWHTSLTRDGR